MELWGLEGLRASAEHLVWLSAGFGRELGVMSGFCLLMLVAAFWLR